jgi:hypothetical protein
MPFDALPDRRQTYLLQKLATVSDMLSAERKWCKHRLRGPDGSRCLVSALYDAGARLVLYQPVPRAVQEVTGIRYYRLDQFNDAAGTRFDTVQAVLDRARLDIAIGVLPHGFGYALRYKAARMLERPAMAAVLRL